MSLTGSLFSGISGLNTLGEAMTVIGDNIANISTVGFKASRVTFQDILSQTVATAAGTAQVGRGTSLSDISSSFSQGSFESTNSTTDLAIGGQGFFIVRDPNNENNEFYTRAGEFRFDKDGNFINPAGFIVRGWALDPNSGEDQGSIGDIRMSSFTSPPSETTTLSAIVNLDSRVPERPEAWDLSGLWAGNDPGAEYLPTNAYDYQTTLKVYDSLGSTHDITLYFARGATIEGSPEWQFIATCNPLEDHRDVSDPVKGLLSKGTIEFSASSGVIQGISMQEWDNDAEAWIDSSRGADGYYAVNPLFITGSSPMSVGLNFGARHNGDRWVNDSLSTTQYAASSTTVFQTANGYGAGDLQSVTVAPDGVITGLYSNGQVLPLYRVALAKFQNVQGLYKEGGNLFRETRLSGDPITGRPGSSGLGSLATNSLEQSNVDLATEFVRMITTQRGYQANTKVITVTDQMLQELINLKR
jgi:flagellar hook protein FlgE